MKNLTSISGFKLILASVLMSLANATAFAQDTITKSSETTSSTTTTWYAEPWAWAVGAAVLIIILIALLRGNGGNSTTDRVTVTKKVERE